MNEGFQREQNSFRHEKLDTTGNQLDEKPQTFVIWGPAISFLACKLSTSNI